MICRFCGHECKKDGRQANGTQRYQCKYCHRK
ncbi:transposase-like zinc-binding domain-containing protein [Barnesiella intestinihominis]